MEVQFLKEQINTQTTQPSLGISLNSIGIVPHMIKMKSIRTVADDELSHKDGRMV